MSGVANAQAAAKVAESQDTLTISPAGRAAGEAQARTNGQKTASHTEHDGDE